MSARKIHLLFLLSLTLLLLSGLSIYHSEWWQVWLNWFAMLSLVGAVIAGVAWAIIYWSTST